jgi:murein DD-endopeptidase MepM/ murein hydrolase activator NlpD
MSTHALEPESAPELYPTRRARRAAEDAARPRAGRERIVGAEPFLQTVRPPARPMRPAPAPLPTRRAARAAERQRTTRAGSADRTRVAATTAVITCLIVGMSSPQVAVAQPRALGDAAVDGTPVQRLGASGVAASTDGRDGYAIATTEDPTAGGRIATAAVRPVDGAIPTAGGFGSRHVAGCSACSTDHHGLDFAAAAGTPVHAVLAGVVTSAGSEGGYGLSVVVRHADGLTTRYAHLSRIDVRVGQAVAAGTVVGRVGSTGVSTGAHLHFEVVVDGRAIDPATWLRARGLL